MEKSPRDDDRRWYKAGVAFSLIALAAMALSLVAPRTGRLIGFCFTLFGFLAITRPSWEKQSGRLRMAGISVGVFATQVAILWDGLARS